MINSQLADREMDLADSISKGMGDQFSADSSAASSAGQYIKGDG